MVLNFNSVRIKVITADIFYVWFTVSSSFTENKNLILSTSYEHSYIAIIIIHFSGTIVLASIRFQTQLLI